MMTPQAIVAMSPVVAVVDDDLAVSNSLKFSLELEGLEVRTFPGGAELLRASDVAACDCFVIDQKMPGMTGWN
jgi:FixJ family two-component response regulator